MSKSNDLDFDTYDREAPPLPPLLHVPRTVGGYLFLVLACALLLLVGALLSPGHAAGADLRGDPSYACTWVSPDDVSDPEADPTPQPPAGSFTVPLPLGGELHCEPLGHHLPTRATSRETYSCDRISGDSVSLHLGGYALLTCLDFDGENVIPGSEGCAWAAPECFPFLLTDDANSALYCAPPAACSL